MVCLTAETAEIAHLVGAGDRVVGVPGTARRPEEVREKPKVGGFTTFRLERILGLEPDLVLAFSDLQADVVSDLVRAGVPVLCTNQRSIDDIFRAVLLVGAALGCEGAARDRPRVYFEEWMDPLIAGIRWVSEAIEIAGGRDVFSELRSEPSAKARVVDPDEVVRRDPEIILASWCGKPVDAAAIAARPGWDRVSAVRRQEIHELDGADVLSPGPSLMFGLRRIHEIIQAAQTFETR